MRENIFFHENNLKKGRDKSFSVGLVTYSLPLEDPLKTVVLAL